jgi:hypothetical protein
MVLTAMTIDCRIHRENFGNGSVVVLFDKAREIAIMTTF